MIENFSAKEIDFISFTNGSSKRNADNLRDWIHQHRISRNEMVSITMNETRIGDSADNLMTLFYRKGALE